MIKARIKGIFSLPNTHSSCMLILSYIIISAVSCEEPAVISDKSIVDISLKNCNISDCNGESLEFMYLIKPNSTCVIQVTAIPEDVHFVLAQVHTYLKKMTLSYNKIPTRDTSVTGMNIGLLKMNTSPVLSYHLKYNTSSENATVMIAVQAYGINAPIPGGCNMEFQVEISPFLKTVFDEVLTEVEFARAAPSLRTLSSPSIMTDNLCNIKPDPVIHRMYRMYLPERNFSEDLYFDSLKSMMTRDRILRNGWSIPHKYGISPMRHSFASYPGTGSVFVAIAETLDGSSVYVPSFTYSCQIDQDSNNCIVLRTTFSKLLCAVVFFLGLFACFAAHRFFKVELLLLGFLAGTVLCYIAAQNLNSTTALTVSVGVGFACGAAFAVMWCFRDLPLFSLITATTILGYLIASSVYYKLVDVFDVLVSDVNYWSLFCSMVLLSPILMISLSEKANIISCSIVGSYASVLAIDYYIGSNLRFIVINTIRRATVSRFRYAVIDPPFQAKDIALACVWAVLAIAGVTVHLLLVRGRPPYPPPSRSFRAIADRFRRKPPSETTPLLRATA